MAPLWGQPLGVAVGSAGPSSQAELANSVTAQGGSQSRLGHLFLFLTTSGILWKCFMRQQGISLVIENCM